MPKFARKCDNNGVVTPTTPKSDARSMLASAITEASLARAALDDTREAEQKARESSYLAQRHADRLRAEVDKVELADDQIVAAIAGGDDDVLALSRPATEIHEAITLADQKAAAWRRAANGAEQAIPVRERALAEAERKVEECARAVLAASLDVAGMLKDAEDAAAWLVSQRATFLHLLSILPPGPDHDHVAHFLSRPWLIGEIDESWKRNPALKPYAAALERLRHDAGAKIEVAP